MYMHIQLAMNYICTYVGTVDWATGMCTECLLMQVRSGVNAMRGQEIATFCLISTVQCPYSLYNIVGKIWRAIHLANASILGFGKFYIWRIAHNYVCSTLLNC